MNSEDIASIIAGLQFLAGKRGRRKRCEQREYQCYVNQRRLVEYQAEQQQQADTGGADQLR